MAVTKNLKFLFAVLFAGCVAADSGDDFSNNLFSDLAPLLALFGERVTMQFMSQSMGWADNVILAMAPLGIITAIVSAIRVGGPSWLKAIIGRARENLAVAEADLMSSTSKEVCELWNGQEVVRCMGSAPVSEFICLLPADMPSTREGPEIEVIQLNEALKKGYLKEAERNIRNDVDREHASQDSPDDSTAEKGQASTIPSSPEIIIVRNTAADAPNISLNSHNQFGRGELRLVAVIGTVLQLGVLTYSGFATYYPMLKFPKDERPIARYAFPCTAAGTLVLVAGMLLCAHVVESSTEEKRYRPGQGKKARLVWLQQTKTVSDQVFASFAVFATGERTLITTSHRADKQSQAAVLVLKTVVGTTVSLCGFVVQFIGLRGMHWSVSVAQLGAVLVMTSLRAWVRRGLAKPPRCQPLLSEFELDWFAMTLGDIGNAPWRHVSTAMADWSIESPGTHEGLLQSSDQTPSNAQRIMKIRRDLGRLADWRGPASAEAVSVARAIEITMDTLFGSRGRDFTWSLITRGKQSVDFRLKRRDGKWKAYSDEVEATLSLWLFSVYQDEHNEEEKHREGLSASTPDPGDDEWLRAKGSPAKRSLRLLSQYTQGLYRDLQWWMSDGATRVIKVRAAEPSDETRIEVERHRIVGSGNRTTDLPSRYRIWEPSQTAGHDTTNWNVDEGKAANPLLATESYGPLKLLYAQDMFSSFMWAAAKTLTKPVEGNADIRPDDISSDSAWQSFKLRNDQLSKMAQDIQSTGLGSLEDIYLSIIPPLSVEHKLPKSDAIIELARQHAKRHEQLEHWKEAGDAYLWLFRTAKTFPVQSSIATKATAVLMEYLRQVASVIELREAQHEESDLEQLKELKTSLEKELKTVGGGTLLSLMRLYEKQDRGWKCDLVQEAGSAGEEDTSYKVFEVTKLHDLAQSRSWDATRKISDALRGGENVNSRDIHEWTPLHYATAKGSADVAKKLLQHQADANARDLLEWTPLHYACQRGETSIVQNLLREGADIDAQGRNGVAPLHCAANGHLDVVESLIEAGAAIDVLDASGNTPLLWAAYRGQKGVVDYLWEDANKKLRDHNGRTALHLASTAGMEEVVRVLVSKGQADKAKDRTGRTPLHLAAAGGHEAVARLLTVELGADKEAKDGMGWTPLHVAAGHGHEAVARLLAIKLGADKEAKAGMGWTPPHVAAWRGYEAVGADKEAKEGMGWTPPHVAAWRGYEAMGADKEAKDGDGRTPLHVAAQGGHEAVTRLLR